VTVPSTAPGFVLGALVGAVATAAGSYFVFWRRQRAATRRLRVALTHELRSLDYVDDHVEAGDYEGVTTAVDVPVVYEANADDLGRLSEREVGALVEFYASLYWLRDLEDPEDKKARIEDVVAKRQTALDAVENA
jgi:HAMP domain-containing protein